MDNNLQSKMAADIAPFRLPRYAQIPDIGLYLEQVVRYVNAYLAPLGEPELSPSMVSNYVKQRLIPAPQKKVYTAEQLARLMFIAAVKPVVPLEGLRLMFGIQERNYALCTAYDYFCDEFENMLFAAFGVAPAFTSWMWVLEGYGKLGIGVAFLYVACTALRLARFNVCVTTVSKKFFVGLPCPAAGCAVAMFILFSSYLPSWLEARTPFLGLLITFVMALLMVSRVRYFSFKEYGFLKTHAFSSMISALLVFVLILSQPVVFGFLLGAIYLLSGPIYTYIILPRRNRQLLGSLTQN